MHRKRFVKTAQKFYSIRFRLKDSTVRTKPLIRSTAPEATALGEVKSIYVDANGNTITYVLDQAGQIVEASDEVGSLLMVTRDEDNLIVRLPNARGNITPYR